MKKYYVLIFLVLANLFWAGNYVFAKYVVSEMTPLQMSFTRWLIAVFLLFPIAHWVERPEWKNVFKHWKVLLIMSLLGIVGYNFFLYEALKYTTSMNAALVNSINPAVLILFSALLLKERISFRSILGLIFSLLGVLLVITKGQLQQIFQIQFNQGDLIMILVILIWTFYSIIGRKMKAIPPISATSVTVLFGLIIMLPFILITGIDYTNLSSQALIGIVYIGIFPSVGSYILWNVAIRHIDANRAGIYLYLVTVFTAILSLILGETITNEQILGGVLVFIGLYVASIKGKKENIKDSEG